ncbi:MAG: TIGR04076 family protein [candidate division KSB1 bacterium]|nr:TIGR04076 family protein [candidate division KSB1 bacterium]MDZ7317827.1 TIGR04076 family protein [candidate division KSB1 bacterium]MDZ7341912.1 TIGR04076 family protein [candidate division KSB1 bacterium]
MAGKDLKVAVIEIQGHCPVYQVGDSFYLARGYILDPSRSGRICLHSLASILPCHVALSHGVAPAAIGLNREDSPKAYLQCLDPCRYTNGGTVTFEVEIMP